MIIKIFFILLFTAILTFIICVFIIPYPNPSSNIIPLSDNVLGINLDNNTIDNMIPQDIFPLQWPLTTLPINSVRTYNVSVRSLRWIEYLSQNKVSIFIGLNNISDVDILMKHLENWSQLQLSHIIAYSVSNETTNVNDMINTVKYLQSSFANVVGSEKPVTACLKYSSYWIQSTYPPSSATFTDSAIQLFSVIDIICFNIYGTFFDLSQQPSLSWSEGSVIRNQFKSIRTAMSKANLSSHPFWASEIGWGGATGSKATKINNVANEKVFYTNFLQAKQDGVIPDNMFWFSLTDSNNEYFGLYTNNGNKLINKF